MKIRQEIPLLEEIRTERGEASGGRIPGPRLPQDPHADRTEGILEPPAQPAADDEMVIGADDIAIRLATAADIPALCELLSFLFAQEADFAPDIPRQSQGLWLIIGQPEVGRIYCAVDAGGVVGMVNLLFTISTAEGGRVALLEDMVVHPSRRGGGIGERLLHAAIQEARTAGCRRITLLTDATNDAAKRFYGRSGFAESPMTPLRLHL